MEKVKYFQLGNLLLYTVQITGNVAHARSHLAHHSCEAMAEHVCHSHGTILAGNVDTRDSRVGHALLATVSSKHA